MKLSGSLILLILLGFSAFGEEERVERIKVTGSHIKRIDQEGTSPVTVIDQEELNFSGQTSLADVVRDLSFASFGVSRKLSLSDGNGAAITSVRGLPVSTDGFTGYILILLNGKRFSSQDLNLIPMSAVERIEIIKDGASATYGSDAIGGVMNFITKKDYTGKSFSVGASLPEPFVLPEKFLKYQGWRSEEWKSVPKFKDKIFGLKGGESLNVDYTEGWTGDNYSSLFNINFKTQTAIAMKDRPFSWNSNVEDFSPNGSPGSYKLIGGKFRSMEGCPTERLSSDSKGNIFCKYNTSELMYLAPTVYTLSVFFTNSLDLDRSELYTHAVYSYENSLGKLAPALENALKKKSLEKIKSGLWDTWVTAVSRDYDASLSNLEIFKYRLADEKGLTDGGRRIQRTHKHLFDLQAGLETYLSDTWSLDVSLSGSGQLNFSRNKNYADLVKLFHVDAGTAKWNPFKTEKSDISYALHEPKIDSRYLIGALEVSADGELFPLGNLGVVSSALGARAGYEHFKGSADEITFNTEKRFTQLFGGASFVIGDGNRYWGTSFLEVLAPLEFNSSNSLELQLAGSADYYQYAGATVNPKVGAKWKVADMLQIKASYGKGFKAPSVSTVFLAETKDHPAGIDYGMCEGKAKENCEVKADQREAIYLGNKKLKPEIADSYNIGFSLEPSKSIYFSLDFFSNHVKDRIQTPDISEITEMAYYHEEEFEKFKTKREIDIAIEGRDQTLQVKSPYYNFGMYRNKGLETSLVAQYPMMDHAGFVKFDALYFLSTEVSRPILDEEMGEDGKKKKIWRKRLGAFGFPSYKLQAALGLQYKNGLRWALSSSWLSSFNATSIDNDKIPETSSQKVSRFFKKHILRKEVKTPTLKAVYTQEATKDHEGNAISDVVRQTPLHVDFDLTIQLPLSVISSEFSSRSSLLFKIENILNTLPPEITYATGDKNIAGVQSTGCGRTICHFYPTNGRTWRVNYTHEL